MKDIKKRLLLRLAAIKFWQLLLYISVALILLLFIIELSFDLDEKTLRMIGIADIGIWFVFVIDLTYHYITTEDKGVFFRQHWLLILSLIPITFFLKLMRSFRALKLFKFGAKAESIAKTTKLAELEPRLHAAYSTGIISSIMPAFRTIKGGQMPMHWKHEKFFVKPRGIKIYTFIGPGANHRVADGILEGIDMFVKQKLRLKPVYRELKDFKKIKNKKDNRLDVFITKNAVSASSINSRGNLSGTVVFNTSSLADVRNYQDSKTSVDYLKRLRGVISAYNKLARLLDYEACNNEHCTFNFNRKDMDMLSFLYHLNREIPLCEKHSKWRY